MTEPYYSEATYAAAARLIARAADLVDTSPESARNPCPTMLRIETGPVSEWHVAVAGRCVCGDGWYWDPNADPKSIASWRREHADHKAPESAERLKRRLSLTEVWPGDYPEMPPYTPMTARDLRVIGDD